METITMTIKEYEKLKQRADHLYDVATALQKVIDDSDEGHIKAFARKALREATGVIKSTGG